MEQQPESVLVVKLACSFNNITQYIQSLIHIYPDIFIY